MKIGGIHKFSLIDFPKKIAALIFTQGCNFRCPFCHNPELVLPRRFQLPLPVAEVIDFLKFRFGKLDGVVVTGGEPLIQDGVEDFIAQIKQIGYAVKLDTNGSSPAKLNRLIKNDLLDYIAMDLKASIDNYAKVCGVPVNLDNILKSMELIRMSGIPYEFRTTMVKNLHHKTEIEQIAGLLKKEDKYIIQNFRNAKRVGRKDLPLDSFTDEELEYFEQVLTSQGITYHSR